MAPHGDAVFTKAEVYAQVIKAEGKSALTVLPPDEISSANASIPTRIAVNGGQPFDLSCVVESGDALFNILGKSILDWIWSGFNASLVIHGTATNVKESSFGSSGFMSLLLAALFHRINSDSTSSTAKQNSNSLNYVIGISAWEVDALSGKINDIFAGHVPYACSPSSSFVTVWSHTLSSALDMLRAVEARREISSSAHECHRFARVVLYNCVKNCVSTFHMANPFSQNSNGAQCLSSLIRKVLSAGGNHIPSSMLRTQAQSNSHKFGEYHSGANTKHISAALSQSLLPLIAGNCKTFFLLALSSSSKVAKETQDALQCCSPCIHMTSACARLTGVPIAALDFQDFEGIRPLSWLNNKSHDEVYFNKEVLASGNLVREALENVQTESPIYNLSSGHDCKETAIDLLGQSIEGKHQSVKLKEMKLTNSTKGRSPNGHRSSVALKSAKDQQLRRLSRSYKSSHKRHKPTTESKNAQSKTKSSRLTRRQPSKLQSLTKYKKEHGKIKPARNEAKIIPDSDDAVNTAEKSQTTQMTFDRSGVFRSPCTPSSNDDPNSIENVGLKSDTTFEQTSHHISEMTKSQYSGTVNAKINVLYDEDYNQALQNRKNDILARNQLLAEIHTHAQSPVIEHSSNTDIQDYPGTKYKKRIVEARSQNRIVEDSKVRSKIKSSAACPEDVVLVAESKLRSEINSVLDDFMAKKESDSQSELDNREIEEDTTTEDLVLPDSMEVISDVPMLLKLLHEEQQMHRNQLKRVGSLEHDLLEQQATYELTIDTLRLERIEILQRLRKMENESNYPELFAQYEARIAKLSADLENARNSLIQMETTNFIRDKSKFESGERNSTRKSRDRTLQSKALALSRSVERDLTRKLEQLEAAAGIAERKEKQFELHKKHLAIANAKIIPLEQKIGLLERDKASLQVQVADHMTRAEAAEKENALLASKLQVMSM